MPYKPKAKPLKTSEKRSTTAKNLSGKNQLVQLRHQYQTPQVVRASKAESLIVKKHIAFLPLLLLTFIIWCVYRRLFQYPVWFDETIGKAVFFGLPVFLYASLTRSHSIAETVHPRFLQPGLWMGLAVGGIFGFAGTLASLMRSGVVIQAAPLFAADGFWFEFTLAMLTGFWESLFFYCWIMVVIMEKFKHWPFINQVLLTAAIFLVFHIPNALLRYSMPMVAPQLFLLFFFALGQACIFARVRNIYALTISHALWGMVLLVHTR